MVEIKQSKTENVVNEILVVGSLWKSPSLYVDYSIKFKGKYDFSDTITKFFFDCFVTYLTTFSEKVTGEQVNTFMAQEESRLNRYVSYGGFATIEKWMERAHVEDFPNYFDTMKKYALLREYDYRGYNVDKIMSFPNFDALSAQELYRLVRGTADRVYTEISANEDSVKLGDNMPDTVAEYLKVPQMGAPYPWITLTEMFRGMRFGKIVLNGYLSNEGKSRNLMMLTAYVALVLKEKFLLMSNEMSEEDLRSALITTVLNNECFKDLHGVELIKEERDIVLGRYRDDKTGAYIERLKDEDGNVIEDDDDFTTRVYQNSSEFRDVLKVSKWIEENGRENILFKDVGSGYSDELLEYEIKRHNLVYNVKYFGYDTLKGYKTDDWQTLKQTTTRLKEIIKEINAFMWAVFQLTDDSVFTNFFDLSSNNIANAKQMKHVVDQLILGKRIPQSEYHLYEYIPVDTWGEARPERLDPNKKYFGWVIDKNRGGDKQWTPLFEYDLNLNVWKNVGSLMLIGV